MLYDRRDFGLLRLAGTYQWLPLAPLRALSSLKHLYREAELLSTLGLLSFSRSNQYLMPSPEGYQFLASMEIDCHAPTKRPYAQSSALRRRLEVGTVLLTCLGAGIEPAYDKVDRLKRQPAEQPQRDIKLPLSLAAVEKTVQLLSPSPRNAVLQAGQFI